MNYDFFLAINNNFYLAMNKKNSANKMIEDSLCEYQCKATPFLSKQVAEFNIWYNCTKKNLPNSGHHTLKVLIFAVF